MGNYLLERRKELGLTQREVADAVGVAEATVSRWESGEIANMRRDKISALATVLHCSTDFVMTGGQSSSNFVPFGYEPLPDMTTVPLIGDIACGTPITAEENVVARIGVPAAWCADFSLTCHGDSMAPKIQDGDVVCIRRQPTVENGEVAAIRIDGEATLKHFYRSGDTVTLMPDNPSVCAPLVYRAEEINDITIEGKAVGICRGL